MTHPPPDAFSQKILATFNDRGDAWLKRLPTLLSDCARRWSLTILPPFPNLSFNYVAPVVRADGSEAVLKAGVPHKELWTEVAALRLYDGQNSVRLLEADEARGVLLLERLTPGTSLTTLADDAHDEWATSIAASVMRGLWRPVPPQHGFPTVGDWAKGFQRLREHFGGGVGPFPVRLVAEAETLSTELVRSSSAPVVVLHGDLHHDNILSAERRPWLAIDPKGVIGEPAYEVGALLRNLWADRHPLANPGRRLERRVHQLADELEIDRARVRGWGVAQAMLSAWWCVEDGGNSWASDVAIAELLAAVKV